MKPKHLFAIPQHKFCFLLLRKNASTSISRCLRLTWPHRREHRDDWDWDDWLRVGVWRDPVERLASAWSNLRGTQHVPDLPFDELVDYVCEREDAELDVHLQSQQRLNDANLILRHDRLHCDWPVFRAAAMQNGLRFGPLRHLNKSQWVNVPPELAERIKERFKDDYQFRLPG